MVQGMWVDFKSYKNGTTDSLMGLGLLTYNIIEEDINLDNQIEITIKTPLVSGNWEKKCSFYKMKNIPSSIDISKTGSYYLDDQQLIEIDNIDPWDTTQTFYFNQKNNKNDFDNLVNYFIKNGSMGICMYNGETLNWYTSKECTTNYLVISEFKISFLFQKYKLTIDPNGGTIDGKTDKYDTEFRYKFPAYLSATTPTRPGYIFNGYEITTEKGEIITEEGKIYSNNGTEYYYYPSGSRGKGKSVWVFDSNVSDNCELKAQWIKNYHTVTLNSDDTDFSGGTAKIYQKDNQWYLSLSGNPITKIDLPETENENKQIVGYFLSNNQQLIFEDGTINSKIVLTSDAKADLKITSKKEEETDTIIENITIEFDPNGGQVDPKTLTMPVVKKIIDDKWYMLIKYSELIKNFPIPTKTGNKFDYWIIPPPDLDDILLISLDNRDKLVLTATWSLYKFGIYFHANGATEGYLKTEELDLNEPFLLTKEKTPYDIDSEKILIPWIAKNEANPDFWLKKDKYKTTGYWNTSPTGNGAKVKVNQQLDAKSLLDITGEILEDGTMINLYAQWEPDACVQINIDNTLIPAVPYMYINNEWIVAQPYIYATKENNEPTWHLCISND